MGLFRKKKPPELAAAPQVQPVVVGHVEISLQMPNGASSKVIFYALHGQSKEDISQNLDVFREILMRQRTICEIPQIETMLEQKAAHYAQMLKLQEETGEKVRRGDRLNSQERQIFENAAETMKAIAGEIQKGKETLARMRREVS